MSGASLVLFDLDDTVLDRGAAFRAWAKAFVTAHQLPPEAVAWLIENDRSGYRPRDELFAEIVERYSVPLARDDLLGAYRADFPGRFSLSRAVLKALRQLRAAGWRIAVVTNGSPSQAAKITATGLDQLVDGWAVSGIEGYRKPDPRLLERAAVIAGTHLTAGSWLVGDNPDTDIGAAAAAGIRSAWVTDDATWPPLPYRPTVTVRTVAQAVDHILGQRRSK